MKKSTLKAIKMVLFGITLVTAGLVTWFSTSLILNIINDNKVVDKNNKNTILLEKSKDVPIKLVEHESSGSYFFGYKGLQAINQRIKSDLQFGPEIENIKTITINNLSILKHNVGGQYNPFTNEISISISNLIPQFQNIPLEEKVELVFPTIFHEYGHHFANTYITSISTNDTRNSKKLFSQNNEKSVHKNIPKIFLQEFEESLHYKNTTINNLLSHDKSKISSKKSARSFYEESNSVNIKNKTPENDYLKINDFKLTTKIPARNIQKEFFINSDQYTYLFSIDELLTRKLQQISYINILNGTSIANKSSTFTGTEYGRNFYQSTMTMDISKNRKIEFDGNESYSINDELILMDYPYGGTFIDSLGKTHIIESTVNNLWNAYLNISGYQHGISQIFLNNTSKQISKTTRSTLSKNDFLSIKFTGFLDNSKKYKSLLLKNKNGLYYIKHDFIKNNYKYNFLSAKSDILSRERDLVKLQNKFGYTTDYINISNVDLTSPIKAWNDKNNNDKVDAGEDESLSVSPNRPTSTFRESFAKTFEDGTVYKDYDIINNNFYEVINNKNNAYLQIYEIDDILSNYLKFNQVQRFINSYIPIFQDDVVLNNRHDKKKW